MNSSILQDVVVTQNTIISLVMAGVILFVLPIIYVVYWKKECGEKASFKALAIGAAGFLVSARVLELGVHMGCIVLDNPVSRFINGNTPAYVIYGIMMAGVFEECGRYVVIKYLMKKNKNRENMVMYGIGHGGIEVWSITLLSVISYLAIALSIKTMGLDEALKSMGITADTVDKAAPTIAAVAGFTGVTAFWYVVERIFCMFVHISLTVVVAFGIAKNQKKYLPLAIFAHAAVDLLPCLYQRQIGTMWMVEGWLLLGAVLLVIWSRKLYKEM